MYLAINFSGHRCRN